MGEALYKLVDEPRLPLRVQFGGDSFKFIVKSQAERTIRYGQKFAAVSHSTNREDMDGEEYIKLLMASGNFGEDK